MKKIKKMIIIYFLGSFILAYLIGGYMTNDLFTQVKWEEGITIWDRLGAYYTKKVIENIMTSSIVALSTTSLMVNIEKLS
jgi:hypothetical protein